MDGEKWLLAPKNPEELASRRYDSLAVVGRIMTRKTSSYFSKYGEGRTRRSLG